MTERRVARMLPLSAEEWSDEAREVTGRNRGRGVGRDGVPNVLATLARHPRLLKSWYGFAAHVIGDSTLSARDRELLILRVAWLCRSPYEWGQHVVMARQAGLSDVEIARVRSGPEAPGWNDADALLLRAVDELRAGANLGDATWQALAAHYDEQQLLDVLFTVGQYQLIANVLNAIGVELDEGLEGLEKP